MSHFVAVTPEKLLDALLLQALFPVRKVKIYVASML